MKKCNGIIEQYRNEGDINRFYYYEVHTDFIPLSCTICIWRIKLKS